MGEQQETRQQMEQEQPQGEMMYCPECGRPAFPRRGWGMRHMGHWGYGGPRWGAYGHHPGHWMQQPKAMMWMGVMPALLGFALGYLVANARMSAMYAFACEEKRKR